MLSAHGRLPGTLQHVQLNFPISKVYLNVVTYGYSILVAIINYYV